MEEEILQSIDKKLDAIVRLLAGNFIEEKNKTEAITALSTLGIDTAIIASVVGTSLKAVHARKSEAKKKKAGVKKAKA